MPRQKLSEFRAKTIIYGALGLPYRGWSIDTSADLKLQLKAVHERTSHVVVKVDEGVKRRFKQGLVLLDVAPADVEEAVHKLQSRGYRWLIVEPMWEYAKTEERYFSLALERGGWLCRYSQSGGVDIESAASQVKSMLLRPGEDPKEVASATGFSQAQIVALEAVCADNAFAFLELNPYIVAANSVQLLDAAVEVDDTAAFFVDDWQFDDLRFHVGHQLTPQEKLIQELDATSPASLKLNVLNPEGSIFLLLSGGGASVVVADEIYNQGYGPQLANYGEYSGNPNSEETYLYTKAVLELLINSPAKQKVLFIGGAVANFTDIAKTFAGVLRAIDEVAGKLKTQQVKVFVRRGGPHQEEGLRAMETMLEKHELLGAVHSPDTPLTEAVDEALKEIAHG